MDTAKLESFVFDKMSSSRLPGLSIALVRGGDVVYARGFGQADMARGIAATPQTLFGAASITKSFVAIAILQLAEKGLLSVSDPVDKFLPCPIPTKGTPIRLEHLLTHTSGMPALAYIEAVLRHAHGIGGCPLPIAGARDVLTFVQGSDDWLESAPGERWFYFNEGYVLLGEIIAKVSGKPYEQYVTEDILRPLEMNRSFFAESDVTRDGQLAVPYVLPKNGQPPRPGRYLYNVLGADGALITNALDLARYASMFLRRGRGVMSDASFEAMTQPRVPMPSEPIPELWGDRPETKPRPSHYGFGVSITDDFLGEPLIGHGGSLIVSTSYMGFMPRSNVGVAVLTNGNGYAMPQLAKVALATLLGRDPETELPFLRTEKLLKELSGHYETYRGTLRAKVTRDGDFLRVEYLCGDQSPGTTTLIPERLDGPEPRFYTIADGARLPARFRKTENGGAELVLERYKFKRRGPLP
jgi:CubicO group peptidase (beta-lactamase class C family)